MALHNNVAEHVRTYTRTDFAALRFKLTRIDGQVIMNLYSEDELDKRGISTLPELSAWRNDLREHLVERARLVNPKVSGILDDARRRDAWSKSVMEFIIRAGAMSAGTDATAWNWERDIGIGGTRRITRLKADIGRNVF
jgi:hypothetical protein